MIYSILLILALIVFVRFYQSKLRTLDEQQHAKFKKTCLIIGIALAVAVLAFLKGNIILGAIASLVAFFSRLIPWLLKLAPLAKVLMSDNKNGSKTGESAGAVKPLTMSKAHAADILGVDVNAQESEIIAAHKRLIQKMHPDKGGSDALAIQINQAKATLLGK